MPSPALLPSQLLGIALVGLWLAALAAAALAVRRTWPEQREWSRKLVHIGTGAVVPIAWATGIDRGIALPAAATITLLAALNHRLRVLPAIEDVGRHSYGTVAYGAAITALLALFWPAHPAAVTAGVVVLALGDGTAGLIGPLWPSPSWTLWGHRKSLLGTGAMAAVSLVALLVLWGLLVAGGWASGVPIPVPSPAALVLIVAVGVALEQVALLGLDNLTVPLAVGVLWYLLARPT